MFSHKSVSNTLNKFFDNNNLLYLGKKNLFYNTLIKNPDFNIITRDNQPFVGILHDDPLVFSQRVSQVYLEYHTNTLVFFHDNAPKALKKEDKYILSNKLKDTIKVFFSNTVRDSWGLSKENNSYSIGYGCETRPVKNKTKDIAVLNFNHNNTISQLYQYIVNIFPNTKLITNIIDAENLADYKIAICLDSIYDILYCVSVGCLVLSNQDIQNTLPGVYQIEDINNINEQLSKILSDGDRNNNIHASQQIAINNFNLDNYFQSLNSIFSVLKNRTYIYEA